MLGVVVDEVAQSDGGTGETPVFSLGSFGLEPPPQVLVDPFKAVPPAYVSPLKLALQIHAIESLLGIDIQKLLDIVFDGPSNRLILGLFHILIHEV